MADLRLMRLAALLFVTQLSSAELSVESLNIRSYIKYRFATTLVTSSVVNRDEKKSREAFFEVILPEEAFISNFSMTVDGEIYPGRVEEKEAAKAAYEEAKSLGQSAGYVKTSARHSNNFEVSVSLKPGSDVTFNLTYQQLLPRHLGMYGHNIHINPKEPVANLEVEVFIEELRKIKKVETEFIEGLNSIPKVNDLVEIKEVSKTSRYLRFRPNLDLKDKSGIDRRFLVKYDVERSSIGGEMLVMDGYFLHFFAPENADDLTPIPKDIVFILDVSGSMSGSKLEQMKQSMYTIIDELSPEDSFNIFTFSSQVHRWQGDLLSVTSKSRKFAKVHVASQVAQGSTNINSALLKGVTFLHEKGNPEHVQVVFFLTDGEPTVGVKSASTIAKNVKRLNEDVATVFGLAFGEGADYNLLKVISVQNNGFARKIYEASDASQQVKGFYDEISTTMLRNLTIKYVNGSVDMSTLTPTVFSNVYKGNDIVIAGKYTTTDSKSNQIAAIMTSEIGDGKLRKLTPEPIICILPPPPFPFPSPFPAPSKITERPPDVATVLEKSWAYMTIQNLLKEKKKYTYKEGNSTIDEQIIKLSLKYNFVTPLTSMVATKPDNQNAKARVEGDEFVAEEDPQVQHSQSYRGFHRQFNSQYGKGFPSQVLHSPGNLPGVSGSSLGGSLSGGGMHYGTDLQGFPQNQYSIRRFLSRRRQKSKRTHIAPTATSIPYHHAYFALVTRRRPLIPLVPTTSTTTSTSTTTTTLTSTSTRPTVPDVGRTTMTHGSNGSTRTPDTVTMAQKVKKIKKKKSCKIVKTLFGFGVKTASGSSCTRVKKAADGVYQLLADETDFTVQVGFSKSSRRPQLSSVSVRDNSASYYTLVDPSNTTSGMWQYNSTKGPISIQKDVVCKGRRGWQTYFIMMDLTNDDTVLDRISKRDTLRRIRKKMRTVKKSKKKSMFSGMCTGTYKKTKLYQRSSQYVAESLAAAQAMVRGPHVQFKL